MVQHPASIYTIIWYIYTLIVGDKMNNLKMAGKIMRQSKVHITNPDLQDKARITDCNFTRNRRLTFQKLVLQIVYGIKESIQRNTEKMFEQLGQADEAVSKQAVTKAQTNFNPVAVKELYNITRKNMPVAVIWNFSIGSIYSAL
jgi:hypothetical protein